MSAEQNIQTTKEMYEGHCCVERLRDHGAVNFLV